jgi:GNAT superfamily N-acetyltransferase
VGALVERNNMDVTLRRYREADKDEVFTLHKVAMLATCAFILSGEIDKDFDDIEGHYFNNGGYFFVVEHDGRIIGMAALRKIDALTAELKRMRVHPDFQRRGIGTGLLNVVEDKARELGYAAMVLDTTVQQRAAQALYEKHGYAMERRGEAMGLDTLFYRKALDEVPQGRI